MDLHEEYGSRFEWHITMLSGWIAEGFPGHHASFPSYVRCGVTPAL
jgi:hypothetical protein